jgi:hypothetical protein
MLLKSLWCVSAPGAFFTPKAFANFSPGFALKPWAMKYLKRFLATPKELRRLCPERWAQPLQPATQAACVIK